MNENEKIDYVKENELGEVDQTVVRVPSRRRIHPAAIAVAGVAVAGLILIIIWFAAFRDSEVGKPVPAPRSTTMEDLPSSEPVTGQTITISAEQLASSGIEIDTIGEQMAAEVGLTAATGVVEANAYRSTPALALIGGVIRRVIPELGDNVSAGQTVAVIFSNEFAEAQSRYVALQTEAANARQNYERTQRLVTINQPGRTELDAAARQVKASEASLAEMQNRYQRTTRLVIIGAASREELEQDRTKLRTAEAELEQSRKQFSRSSEVARINPVSNREFEEAAVKLRTAEAELSTARQRLILLGLSESRVNALRSPSQITSETAIQAPVSGTVTTRAINQGEVVEANKELMKVTNLSTVWVIAQIYEKDLGRMRVGTGASVTTDAYPGQVFRGQVTYIDPNINQETRTAQARVELENPGQMLKIGMYVNVSFGALGTGEMTAPVIPSSAVQNMNNQKVVFAATDKPNVFVMKTVRTGSETGGRLVVLEGLNVGDKIVTEGSFLLRAELMKQNPSHQH